VVLSLGLNTCLIVGGERLIQHYGRPLLYCAFLAAIPTISLAQDKNIWKNEFRQCPKWLRIAAATFMIYGLGASFVSVSFNSQSFALGSLPLFVAALPLFLESGPLCILYSTLHGRAASGLDLKKQVGVSLITVAVCGAVISLFD
jgi:hypothetical protein